MRVAVKRVEYAGGVVVANLLSRSIPCPIGLRRLFQNLTQRSAIALGQLVEIAPAGVGLHPPAAGELKEIDAEVDGSVERTEVGTGAPALSQ